MNLYDLMKQAAFSGQQGAQAAVGAGMGQRRPARAMAFPQPQDGGQNSKEMMGLLLSGMGKIPQHYDMSGNLINPATPKLRGLDEFYAMQRPNADGTRQSSPTITPAMTPMAPRTPLQVEPVRTTYFNSDTPNGGPGFPGAQNPATGGPLDWLTGFDANGQPTMQPSAYLKHKQLMNPAITPGVQAQFNSNPNFFRRMLGGGNF